MKFPSKELKAKSGSISGFIFENPNVGLKRGLFLSLEVDFEPIKYGDEEWECSLASEWIPYQGESWMQISDIDFENDLIKEMNETTFYMVEHDWCNDVQINIIHHDKNVFRLQLDANVEFSGYYSGDEDPSMPVHVDVLLPFTGFIIRRDNLFPKPSNSEDAIKVAQEFIGTSSFKAPTLDGEVFKFEPKIQ